ncbi:MAG: murein L,D-transpeptidase catalytic domain family protein [Paludibacter sp.]|nr:murein L,D-transpeptidase catalytic domain family protein [Paludibacter sp.]
MKKIIFVFSLIIVLLVGTLSVRSQTNDSVKWSEKTSEALSFCRKNGFNTDFCILIDMKIHSGKYRMFVWNFVNQEIEHKALCAHGCGKGNNRSTGAQPVFSNTPETLLSSLGKYKIGIRSYSQYGINVHYKMHGLETTNNNAFKRLIVLHSHNPVPENEIYPSHLPMGWSFGCPVTDNATMTLLDKKLRASKKSVLIWIYY